MKTTSKFIGSVLALIIVILAIFLVTKFNSHESARVSTSSSPAKTVKKSSSSSSKVVKKDKKSAQSSTSAVSNEENDNQASAVSPKASSQSQAGTTD
ncbi:MAG: transcriptional regulator, partial [Streptococcus sp.]|nr:transcriptional regulator [Streptococcus sp.]